MTNTIKNTLELVEGDIVHAHGMRLELANRGQRVLSGYDQDNADRLIAAGHEPVVVWFESHVLNTEEVDAAGLVHKSWRTGNMWTIQGNAFASWTVED